MTTSFDRVAYCYDETRNYPEGIAERLRDTLLDLTAAGRDARFLEIGIGTGRIALPFIQAGYNYVGFDLSQAMMEQLRLKLAAAPRQAVDRSRLVQANMMDIPFADRSFDVALTAHVLHLAPDLSQVLRHVRRVVRPGGFLLVIHDEPSAEEGPILPSQEVWTKWPEILTEVGHNQQRRRRGMRGFNERLLTALHELDAEVEQRTLFEFGQYPRSAREIAERFKARMYSSDWNIPEDIHTEAVRRLDRWLNEECAAPDQIDSVPSRFQAVVVRWPT